MVIAQPIPTSVVATGAPSTTLTFPPVQKKAKDFLIFSVILILIGVLHGNIPNVIFTLPALICSLAVCVMCVRHGNNIILAA